jgi:hypothetical protein
MLAVKEDEKLENSFIELGLSSLRVRVGFFSDCSISTVRSALHIEAVAT